jgi:hypothetical protein
MALRLSTGLVKKMIDTSPVRTLLTGGKCLIFPGTQPTDADNAAGVTPLVTLDPITFEATATGGILIQTVGADWEGTVTADGTAGGFRICEAADSGTGASTTLARIDGAIATSGAQMNLASLTFVEDAPFIITSAAITFPKE